VVAGQETLAIVAKHKRGLAGRRPVLDRRLHAISAARRRVR